MSFLVDQDDEEHKKARSAELEYESLKVNTHTLSYTHYVLLQFHCCKPLQFAVFRIK